MTRHQLLRRVQNAYYSVLAWGARLNREPSPKIRKRLHAAMDAHVAARRQLRKYDKMHPKQGPSKWGW